MLQVEAKRAEDREPGKGKRGQPQGQQLPADYGQGAYAAAGGKGHIILLYVLVFYWPAHIVFLAVVTPYPVESQRVAYSIGVCRLHWLAVTVLCSAVIP